MAYILRQSTQLLYRNHRGIFISSTPALNIRNIFKAPTPQFHATATRNNAQVGNTSVKEDSPNVIRFDESVHVARLNDDDDGIFTCDEEPFMIGPPHAPGYIPLQFGEILQGLKGKYKVLRKLGWGATSSVWLAQRLETPDESYVAIKILTCSETAAIMHRLNYELVVFASMDLETEYHRGRAFCVKDVETFNAQSPHGVHLCIVTEPYAMSLQSLVGELSKTGLLRGGPFIKTIVKQVLLALEFLHSIGFVHTDVKADNLLIPLSGQQTAISEWLKEHPSSTYPPRNEPSLRPVPLVTAKTEPLPPLGLPSSDEVILHLSDYGSAIPEMRITPDMCAMPTVLRAPEIILGHRWGRPVDIWAVGCLTLELMTRRQIFNIDRTPDLSFTDVHLARIDEFVGPFPPEFLDGCNRRAEFFDADGHLIRPLPPAMLSNDSIKDRLTIAGLRDEELTKACAFIGRALTIDPARRPSASELLEDDWLQSDASHA